MSKLEHTSLILHFVAQVKGQVSDLLQDPAAMDELKALWRDYPVIIFRKQMLEEQEQIAFCNAFGQCEAIPRKDIMSPYHQEIIYFSTLRYADGSFLGGFAGGDDVQWHSDQTYLPSPATGAALYGLEVPKGGGDIYWANEYAAYESLPDDVKGQIEGKTGRFSYAKRLEIFNPKELSDKTTEQATKMKQLPEVFHPVVLTHPVTGRKAIYADPTTLMQIEGFSKEENDRILPILFEAGGRKDFSYRHKVNNGDLMLWDNGCTMHRRDEMRLDQPRLMKRTTFRLSPQAYCTPQ